MQQPVCPTSTFLAVPVACASQLRAPPHLQTAFLLQLMLGCCAFLGICGVVQLLKILIPSYLTVLSLKAFLIAEYPGEDDVYTHFFLVLNYFILVCCILVCLLKVVHWIVQHLLLFTWDYTSQRITMPLHSPGLRIWSSHLL